MDKAAAGLAAASLAAWFPRYPIGDLTIALWADEFSRHDEEVVEAAMPRLRATKDRNGDSAPPQGDDLPEVLASVEYARSYHQRHPELAVTDGGRS